MTLRKKLEAVAHHAAYDATLIERHRCVWAVDRVVESVKAQFEGKILTPVQLDAAKRRVELLVGFAELIRASILSGDRPRPPASQQQEQIDGPQAAEG